MATHNAGVIVPGETAISNTVTVENVGNYPAYIRMFVKKHWGDHREECYAYAGANCR